MFHKSKPLTFIFVTIRPYMDPISMSFRVLPLSNIMITLRILPKSLAFFHSINPFTIIYFSVSPFIDASSMSFSILKVAFVDVTRCISLVSLSMTDVFHPVSLVKPPINVLHNSLAFSDFRFWLNLTHIKGIFILQNLEIWKRSDFLKRLIGQKLEFVIFLSCPSSQRLNVVSVNCCWSSHCRVPRRICIISVSDI